MKRIIVIFCCFFSLILCSCNILDFWKDGDGDAGERIQLTFYGWGNATEVSLTEQFVSEYNKSQDEIYVNYTSIASNDYATKIRNALSRSIVPDVIIAGDGEIKPWIEMGGLMELDSFLYDENGNQISEFDMDDFWQEGQNRYYYNKDLRLNYRDDLPQTMILNGKTYEPYKHFHTYGIMRDLSPTVLFYNVRALQSVGVNIISMTEEEVANYNSKKSTHYEAVGYKEYTVCPDPNLVSTLKSNGSGGAQTVWRVFNNKIPMTWDVNPSTDEGFGELIDLARITSGDSYTDAYTKPSTRFGIYYNTWFSLGWSVGANSLQWVNDSSKKLGGYFDFTMVDKTPNYKVMEGNQVNVNGHVYNGGELIAYTDIKAVDASSSLKNLCYQLPSAYQATKFYVDLSLRGFSPKPDVTSSTSQYAIFSSGNQVAMTLDSRYSVGIWRKSIKKEGQSNGFDWNCAPAPQHVHGIPSGHSGSLAYCIPKNSKHPNEAFKFIEYINGEMGQKTFAKEGYTIPNTKKLSNSPDFLVEGAKPTNSQIFIDAASYQTVGDWGFLPDKDWINIWASKFNSKVLSGKETLSQAFSEQIITSTRNKLNEYYQGIN